MSRDYVPYVEYVRISIITLVSLVPHAYKDAPVCLAEFQVMPGRAPFQSEKCPIWTINHTVILS